MEKRKRLVLIDGNAILHRAYHALPPLTSPDGKLVNAVYGFTSIIIKLFYELHPTHLAVAFDRPAPTFRKELFKEYQATRPKMDEELSGQIEIVHDMVKAFGIPIYEIDGYEADDVLGTLAKQATDNNQKSGEQDVAEVIIVTGDRDLLQLVVDDKVLVFMPTKGISEGRLYSEKDVVERMGVAPKKLPDYKALAGDQSDNYPGVAGIGPKTAAQLVNAYGSVDGVYAALKNSKADKDGISPKVKERLVLGKEAAKMALDLATIRQNIPITYKLEEGAITTLDSHEIREKLSELNFPSLIKRLQGRAELKNKSKKSDLISDTPKDKDSEQLSLV